MIYIINKNDYYFMSEYYKIICNTNYNDSISLIKFNYYYKYYCLINKIKIIILIFIFHINQKK